MASNAYITGRKKYARPQAMLWSDTPPQLVNGLYIPEGVDVLDSTYSPLDSGFIILSDDNREPLQFSAERIEHKQRTINGRMRSHHIADKLTLQTGWQMLPSKSFALDPEFDSLGKSSYSSDNTQAYTTDGGAGGAEILNWYNNHTGSFWVLLSYDNYKDTTDIGADIYSPLNITRYTQALEMFVSDFQYSVEKRSGSSFDMWNISITLEEA